MYNNAMNFSRFSRLGCLLALLCAASLGQAQVIVRVIPPQAAYGEMGAIDSNQVVISKYTYRLAPGLLIRGRDNLLVFPQALRALSSPLKVRYLIDMNGDLFRLWILTADEIATLNPKLLPPQPLPQPSAPTMVAPGRPTSSYSN